MSAACNSRAMPPVLLLDRDGVINENREHYVRSWEDFRFLPGAVESLAALSQAGYCLVVLTNQSMVGRGLVSQGELDAIHTRMCQAVAGAGGAIADILVCPHPPEAECACRKPRPGLVLEARRRFRLGEGEAYMVADHVTDVAAAVAGGCRPILVATGRGGDVRAEVERCYGTLVTYVSGLPEVANLLLSSAQDVDKGAVSVRPSHECGT